MKHDSFKTSPIKERIYIFLFILSIFIVFRFVPILVGLVIIPIMIFLLDREAFKHVDYSLLCTFLFFFIFSSNLSRIPQVNLFFSHLLSKNTYLTTLLCCQCMSNVPTSILLSKFTTDYIPLLYGVNIGGCGTLIASLASLITFNQYKALNPQKIGKYLCLFTLLNLIFIVTLSTVCLILLK